MINEDLRLLAVQRFANYNLQMDADLQELISMAADICDTPTAAITLIDEDSQWLKVKIGIEHDKIPRETSFCNYAILSDELMVVPDTLRDTRLVNNPLVVNEPNFRFYAAAPLITTDGQCLGTLCVADQKPHTLNKYQKIMLKMLSKQAINIMELKLSQQLLEQHQKELEEQKRTISEAEIKLRSFFESSVNFHVLLGKKGELLDYNKTAYSFVKKAYQAKLLRGCEFVQYIEPSFRDTFLVNYTLCLAGEKSYEEGFTDYPELGRIWWEASFEPAYNNDNEIIGISYLIRNVTDRKTYEQKIIEQNQSLIKIAYIQAHEYRGPLTSIMGLMNLIKEDNYVAPPEYLRMMETVVNKLDAKIHEIINNVNNIALDV
jgi:PAS domain S-box-containing protein